jgi:hypothetical protein
VGQAPLVADPGNAGEVDDTHVILAIVISFVIVVAVGIGAIAGVAERPGHDAYRKDTGARLGSRGGGGR